MSVAADVICPWRWATGTNSTLSSHYSRLLGLSPAISIPNIHQLWSVLKGSRSARTTWALFGICKSMLANPTSTKAADVDRRARVLQREQQFNTVLAEVCATYTQCRWDGLAVFNTSLAASDITTRDYFHPSIAGQKKLAAATWGAGPWGPQPPASGTRTGSTLVTIDAPRLAAPPVG